MQRKLILLDELQCELVQLQKLQELAKSKHSPNRCIDPVPYRPSPMDAMDTLPMELVTPYDSCLSTTKAWDWWAQNYTKSIHMETFCIGHNIANIFQSKA